MMHPFVFRLKVQKVEQLCLFELSWGQGKQVTTALPFADSLTERYQEWRRIYLSFYKTVQMPLTPIAYPEVDAKMRGRVLHSGNIVPVSMDWHIKLVEAETRLLNEFHRWLRSAELFELRAAIARQTHYRNADISPQFSDPSIVNVFLTCTPLELARFPWEAWEIGTDFATTGTIRIVRTPATIRSETAPSRKRPKRARILAILGDDSGLNFQADRDAVQSLSRLAEIKFVGWQLGQTATEVKHQIRDAIADEQGWDVLFFAGHSNETQITGGELAIAPDVSILIQEIAPQLIIARECGLQFAIFNSCSGLNIAESLIDLGFSQVAVMREPIHNRVAQEFLIRFLQTLADHKDAHTALIMASQFLRVEKNLIYPSAYLVPSFFCHPDAVPFRIPTFGWKQRARYVLPTRLESIALTVLLAIGLVPTVQQFLLDQRVWVQAIYRNLTQQIPPPTVPPVALVQIDEASIRQDERITKPAPISRAYLADLVDHLTQHQAKIVGIDYLLDRRLGDEQILRKSIHQSIQQNKTWITFGTLYNQFEAENIFTAAEQGIADREWSTQGYVSFFSRYVTLPYPHEDCRDTCPFAYLLSSIQAARLHNPTALQPSLNSQHDLRIALMDQIQQDRVMSDSLHFLQQAYLTSLTVWAYEELGLMWLEPIIDYSIPPDRIYDRITAWRLLEHSFDSSRLAQQVVIIGGGEYTSSELSGNDQYPLPPAVQYWRDRLPDTNNAARFPQSNSVNTPTYLPKLTGAEAHAYMVHHLLNQRLVVPIPDIWLVGIGAIAGKTIALSLRRKKQQKLLLPGLLGATAIYGLISLQAYISAAILLPWILPSATVWVYFLLNKAHRHV
jgi:CHASE2 domain-containing sensor protein